MAVTKLSNSGIKTGILKYDSMLAGNDYYEPSSFLFIQRVAGTGTSASITFSSIPQTYQHLQIRWLGKTTDTASDTYTMQIAFNGTTSGYAAHRLYGDGASAAATGSSSATDITTIRAVASSSTANGSNTYAAGIIDIHDYVSTTKNKTLRMFSGVEANTGANASYRINLTSGFLNNTSAISSITLTTSGTAFTTGSTFALYGIKGV